MGPIAVSYIVAQLGARRHYAVPRALNQAGSLERLFTDIAGTNRWMSVFDIVPRMLQPNSLKRLLGRVPAGIPPSRITEFPGLALEYHLRKIKATTAREHAEADLWSAREFNRLVLRRGFGAAEGVLVFSGAGLEILSLASQRGLKGVMDQVAAPGEFEFQLHRGEAELHPEWATTTFDTNPEAEMNARVRAEWASSSLILCGSTFTRNCIAACGGPVERCVIVPYGIEPTHEIPRRPAARGPLRVLTLGRVSLMKGTPYLLAAAERLRGKATFRMVGSIAVPKAAEARLRSVVELTGPVLRSEVAKHLGWADVLVFPTVCDGFGLVILEALSAGLPVVASANSGALDILREGIDGFVVAPQDVDAIVGRLDRLAGDPDLLEQMSEAAHARSLEFSIESYRDRLLSAFAGNNPRVNVA